MTWVIDDGRVGPIIVQLHFGGKESFDIGELKAESA